MKLFSFVCFKLIENITELFDLNSDHIRDFFCYIDFVIISINISIGYLLVIILKLFNDKLTDRSDYHANLSMKVA